jgi:hypothetical protein
MAFHNGTGAIVPRYGPPTFEIETKIRKSTNKLLNYDFIRALQIERTLRYFKERDQ